MSLNIHVHRKIEGWNKDEQALSTFFVFAGWPWSLDMAGTSGSTQRAWWWVDLMPSVRENSGSRCSRMWVGLKFHPVVVRNSSEHDSSLWKGSFSSCSTRTAEFNCRYSVSVISAASAVLLLKHDDRELLKRGRWRDATKVCRQTNCRGFSYQLILVLSSASRLGLWTVKKKKNKVLKP